MSSPELSALSIVERYHAISATFADVLSGVSNWEAPTPVEGWRVCDVVSHLASWLPAMLAAKSDIVIEVADGDDPVLRWHSLDDCVRAILADDELAYREYRSEPPTTVGQIIDRYFTTDVFMHTWDVARASGQPTALDPRFAAELLEMMYPREAAMRESGEFGPAHPIDREASAQEALIAFIGRDPYWRAEALVD